MPRHADPRLRLTRMDRGYDLSARGTTLAPSAGKFEDECGCGLPICSWERKRTRCERGYRKRVGSWVTADQRFTLTWDGARGVVSRSHPGGYLRMWDAVRLTVDWFTSVARARDEMKKRYELMGGT